jgi:hypothetical protein
VILATRRRCKDPLVVILSEQRHNDDDPVGSLGGVLVVYDLGELW